MVSLGDIGLTNTHGGLRKKERFDKADSQAGPGVLRPVHFVPESTEKKIFQNLNFFFSIEIHYIKTPRRLNFL